MPTNPWYVPFNDIATPIIAIVGFFFIWKQISVGHEQVKLMKSQIAAGLDLSRATNLPYFTLGQDVHTDGNSIWWVVALTNCGMSPAFQVTVRRTQQGDTVMTGPIVEYESIRVGESKTGFELVKLPIGYRSMKMKMIVEYRNVFGEELTQVWETENEQFKLVQPPKIKQLA
ncbi:hypothetical protein [Alicyclobacillus tolerans]|uniref:Uncharacterized protein n=1 Tax=Alicyclobacillus tolerans TaxID=90970 RepID=A0ABT9LZG7_9BACL|nr:hypothetical protein [Alicyclobacillus tengchongensis]KRW90643.1 hypothetical protein SD51_13660 [Alicyclobacillus tengchongensis]MDP9729670.1 hypothetical protein [Alicyclobacillus tengchongensis]